MFVLTLLVAVGVLSIFAWLIQRERSSEAIDNYAIGDGPYYEVPKPPVNPNGVDNLVLGTHREIAPFDTTDRAPKDY